MKCSVCDPTLADEWCFDLDTYLECELLGWCGGSPCSHLHIHTHSPPSPSQADDSLYKLYTQSSSGQVQNVILRHRMYALHYPSMQLSLTPVAALLSVLTNHLLRPAPAPPALCVDTWWAGPQLTIKTCHNERIMDLLCGDGDRFPISECSERSLNEDWGDPNHVNLNISDIESSFSKRDEDREGSQKQPPEQGLLSILFGPFSKHSPGFTSHLLIFKLNQTFIDAMNPRIMRILRSNLWSHFQ